MAVVGTGERSKSGEAQFDAANSHVVAIGQILCVVVPLAIWFSPLDIEPQTKHGLAISPSWWWRGSPRRWTSHSPGSSAASCSGRCGVVRIRVAFSGFANDTAWFLFSALLSGVIATKSGIARRLAYTVMLRVGITYPRILLGLIITDFLLTFIVPSGIARLVIMAGDRIGLAEAFRAEPGSNIVSRGMFLILTYTGNMFDKMIIAGAGSITARGLMQKFGGIEVLWGKWFLAFLPCSIITVLAAWKVTLWLYPPEQVGLAGGRNIFREELKKWARGRPMRDQGRGAARPRHPALGHRFPAPHFASHDRAGRRSVRDYCRTSASSMPRI